MPGVDQVVTQAVGILGTGAIVALVAVGLAVSFRLMNIINLAHGEFIMIGAYAGVLAQSVWGLPWLAAVAIAVGAGLLLGAAVEVLLIRRLYRSPQLSILGTFGLAIVLQELVVLAIGKQYQRMPNPVPGPVTVLGVIYPRYQLLLVVIAAVIMAVIIAALRLTPLGVRVRAVAADNQLAETLGVRASRLNLGVFAVSTGLAALAGVLLAPITTVSPTMGQDYLFTAFIAVIVGGVRVGGVLLAAILVAAVQNLTTSWSGSVIAHLAILGLAFAALQWFRRSTARVVA